MTGIGTRRLFAAAALAAGLTAGGPAGAVTVSGVTFDLGANLGVNSFYQNSPTTVGQTLSAVGRIDEINNNIGFCSGCELDFVASGFTLASASGNQLGFTGGTVTLYVNTPGTLNTGAGSLAAIIGAVSAGTPWLNLGGHPAATSLPGGPYSLTATTTQAGAVTSIFGSALLDVVAGNGTANGFFNTNTFGDGLGGFADIALGSHTDPQIACPPGVALCGSGDVRSTAQQGPTTVPEPASLGFLGMGLLAAGWLRRRRR